MKIYIARGDKQFGPYAREQLQTMLANGEVVPTDLAWHEGMEQWAPLSEIPGVIPAPKLPPILAPPILASHKPSISGSGKLPIESLEPSKDETKPLFDPNDQDHVKIEAAIREIYEIPEGQLTKLDLEMVVHLHIRNQLTDVGALASLTKLIALYLSGNQLTDVSPLAGLTQLETLDLSGNQLTDVSPLAGLTRMKSLSLKGNPNLTDADIAQLQIALPNCKITYDTTTEEPDLGSSKPKKTRKPGKNTKRKKAKKKKKQYQAPGPEQTIVIEYLNYAGELKQFIGDPKSIVRKGNHFSVRVAPTFKRISLNRSKTRILKGVPAPAALPAEPLPVQTTTSDTSVIQYTNFEGIDKEFTIITGVIDDKGDYMRVRVSPTFKYITLKRTRIGNPEALFESTPVAAAPAGETAQVTPEPVETEEPVSQVTTGTVNMVLTSCGLATYDVTKTLDELRPDLGSFEIFGLLQDFPKTVAENVPVEKANEFKKRFEDAGCTVELHPWTGPSEQPETIEATEPPPETEVAKEKSAAIEEPEPVAEVTEPEPAPEQESTPEPEPASATSATMDVVITGCGISTYNANKLLQELKPGVGYFDISKLLRDFPQVVFENLPPEEAEGIKAQLEAAGCTIETQPHGS